MRRGSRPPGVTLRDGIPASLILAPAPGTWAASLPPCATLHGAPATCVAAPSEVPYFAISLQVQIPRLRFGMTPKTAFLTSVEFAVLPYQGGNARHSQRAAGWPTRSNDDVVPPEDPVPKEAEVPLANGRIWCGPVKYGTDSHSFKVTLQNQMVAVFVVHNKSPSRRWTLLE